MSVHTGPAADGASRPVMNLPRLRDLASRGEKIGMLTCYDATFAHVMDEAGVEVMLVGDSLGNVVQGQSSTLPVTLEHMAYHTACVARAKRAAWLVTDMPFGSYEAGPAQAFESAAALMRAGAQMVKLEGAGPVVETVRFLVDRGIPVCAHLGLTPQRVHALGGFRVQGRDDAAAAQLLADAKALAEAGAAMLVLELVPSTLAKQITESLPTLITIGIGAGASTGGQVLVMHDLLGLTPGRRPKFVRDFTRAGVDAGDEHTLGIADAFRAYMTAVKDGSFPDEQQHGY